MYMKRYREKIILGRIYKTAFTKIYKERYTQKDIHRMTYAEKYIRKDIHRENTRKDKQKRYTE